MENTQTNLRISLVAMAIMLVLYAALMIGYGMVSEPLPSHTIVCEQVAQPHPLCMSSPGS